METSWLMGCFLAEAVELLDRCQTFIVNDELSRKIDEYMKLYRETLKEEG